MKLLTLNCQKGYNRKLTSYINQTLESRAYDFLLLQEASREVIEKLQASGFNYQLLRVANKDTGKFCQAVMFYRDTITLEDQKFYSFVKLHPKNVRRVEYGLLLGQFKIGGLRVIIGNLHSYGGLHFMIRSKEAFFVSQCIIEYNKDRLPVVFGGDFNSGLPWEVRRNNRIFQPEFVSCTDSCGPTCDSRWVEPVSKLNRTGLFLAKFGVQFLLKTDHVYVDKKTSRDTKITCRVLNERVSDHCPVELYFSALK